LLISSFFPILLPILLPCYFSRNVLVKAAGELVPEETSAHTLRHTFARSYLALYPGDVVGLATLLGHSSLDTTRLYSQPEASQLATRVERLEINAYSG
jgi:integrase/recombinase XerC